MAFAPLPPWETMRRAACLSPAAVAAALAAAPALGGPPDSRRSHSDRCSRRHSLVRRQLQNRGSSRFRTDAYGRRAGAGLLQVVSRRLRIDQSRECCGTENAFVMERPSDGGIYRAGRGLNSANFEFPGYCVLRAN